jgi:hypothetical protein
MKVNKKINEGFFTRWMDKQTGGEYSRLKGLDPNEVKNPTVISQVAMTGFNDYKKRLDAANINVSNRDDVLANEDTIKDSLIQYVRSYMTTGEENKTINEILIGIETLSDAFRRLPPNSINLNAIKEYFMDTAKKRAEIIFKLKTELPTSNKIAISNISSLMANIPDTDEIVFETTLSTRPGEPAWVFIRKKGVYLLNLPDELKSKVDSGVIGDIPKVEITHSTFKYQVYEVKNPTYLNEIFEQWKRYIGGTIPSKLDGYTSNIETPTI